MRRCTCLLVYLMLSAYTFNMPRYFTPAEANETLELIRPILEEMMRIAENIHAHQPELWDMVRKSAGNGGNPALSEILVDFDRLDGFIHNIQDMGIQIKDLIIGLIDFPAMHEGREVYLCWQFGEGDVEYWHEIEAGFAGRRLINWE
ncbi:MAG: DUF2203 domain-containing protein [Chloroflexi bacterium]|nr:DUF2203 domain-containing protein [Chloroflexota bacterium]